MTESRDFGELFVHSLVRHSTELASTLWGATICIIDRDLKAHFPVVAPPPVVELLTSCLAHKKLRQDFDLHFAPLFTSSPDWTGPRWHNPTGGFRQLVTPIGAASGPTKLLCVPFVYYKETEEKDQQALAGIEASLKNPMARGCSDQVPVLSAVERRKLQTHMSTLGREMDMLLSRVTRRAGDVPRKSDSYPGLVGTSRQMEDLKRRLKVLASDDSPLLIWGEVGSGRRTVARTLHILGNRSKHPLVAIDCQATPYSELVSSLLGRKWRYGDRPELEKMVGEGTVVFHEVDLMPQILQQFFLQYCDGWDTAGTRGPRLVATSSRSIEALEKMGSLRPELLALLRANALYIPPVRKRKEDIPALAADMLLRFRALSSDYPHEFSKDVLRVLQGYEWPGNLWEMKGELRHMATNARGRREIGTQDLSQRIGAHAGAGAEKEVPSDQGVTLPDAVEALERGMLMDALSATRWNRSRTAKVLGVSRRNLIRKIERYQLDRRKREAAARSPD